MQLTCPCCQARFPIEAALTDDAARQAVAAALRLPHGLGPLILRYMGLFRPEKRALSWERAARLLTELAGAIEAGEVTRHGRAWPAPHEYWRTALEQLLARSDKLTRPLRSHAYLYEVVAGLAAKAEGQQEAKAESDRGYRYNRASGGLQPARAHIDRARGQAEAAKLKRALKR